MESYVETLIREDEGGVNSLKNRSKQTTRNLQKSSQR